MKPDIHQVLGFISAEYCMTMAEVRELLRTPTHPATMRDEFAGLALSGLLAFPEDAHAPAGMTVHEYLAIMAYQYADAMLAERTKEK